MTVRAGLAGHANSLGIVRLVLAVTVIVSHASPLGGWGADPGTRWTHGQENLGGFAVLGFFAISGYLITRSGMRGDVVTFLWHRVLRIFPAFWTVLLVTAVVVGPVAWRGLGRSFGSYWTVASGPFDYLGRNALLDMNQYGIADLLSGTPYGPVFNGSLWSLSHEFFCYLIVAVLVVTTVLARPRWARITVPALTLGFLVIRIGIELGTNLGTSIPFLYRDVRTMLVFVFLVGACIAVFSEFVVFDDRFGIAAVVVVVVTAHYGWLHVVGLPALAYAVLWLGYRLPRAVQWIGARNDYSYGVYLYGFLVEQVLAALHVYRWGYVPFVLLAIVISAGCAWLSWHGVEKHAMSLKDRGPGRGIAAWVSSARGRRVPPRRDLDTAGSGTA